MKHQYTVELLFHFNCGTCKNWWSYATTPSCLSGSIEYNSLPESIDYYCPHCGAAEKVEIKGDLQGSDILPMFCSNTSFQLYGWFASSWGGRDVKDGRPEVPNFPANNLTLKLYFGII